MRKKNLYHINYIRKLKEAMSHYLLVEYDYDGDIFDPLDFKSIIENLKIVDIEKKTIDNGISVIDTKSQFSDFLTRYSNSIFSSQNWLDTDRMAKMCLDEKYDIFIPRHTKTLPLDLSFLSLNVFIDMNFTKNINNMNSIVFEYNIDDYNELFLPHYVI